MSYMQINEFIDIIKSLVEENKELRKRLDVMDTILHSYLPIVERKENESNNKRMLSQSSTQGQRRSMLRMFSPCRILHRLLGRGRRRRRR